MPIPIDTAAAGLLGARLNEALELVHNEFTGLDLERQYRNAFARLLKPDPLGRVLMLGTDQRDLFIPILRSIVAESVPAGGHLLDLGAGDGQTFSLLADAVPAGTTVSFEEPNPHYFADYRAALARLPHLRPGFALSAPFDDIDSAAEAGGMPVPTDASQDLVLALHMIYFLGDLPAGLLRMARFVRPGGALLIVVADESTGYTGRVLESFVAAGGTVRAEAIAAIAQRQHLLGPVAENGGALLPLLQAQWPHAGFVLETLRQPSRLYGHSLADLIALANIAVLAGVDELAKFDAACQLLRTAPESVDLRIEEEGPRAGMWSVRQPQFVAVLRRAAV